MRQREQKGTDRQSFPQNDCFGCGGGLVQLSSLGGSRRCTLLRSGPQPQKRTVLVSCSYFTFFALAFFAGLHLTGGQQPGKQGAQ